MRHSEETARQKAVRCAKLAIRAYATEPSVEHAQAVEKAWRRIRQIDALTRWREAVTTPSMSASDGSGFGSARPLG